MADSFIPAPQIFKRFFYLRLLSSLYLATFLIRIVSGIALVGFATWAPPEDVGGLQYSLLFAAAPISEFIFVLVVGVLIDRYGRRGMLLFGLMIGAVSMVLTILTTNYWVLTGVKVLTGIGAASILVTSLTLLTDYAPKEARGREMGAFDAVNMLGWVLGIAGGYLLLGLIGDRNVEWMFLLGGALMVAGLVYSVFNVKEPAKSAVTNEFVSLGLLKSVVTNRSVLLLILPWFGVFIIFGAVLAFLPTEGSEEMLDLTPIQMSLAIILVGAVLIGTQVFYGRISDKYGRLPVLTIGTVGFVGLIATLVLMYVLSGGDPAGFAKANQYYIAGPLGFSVILALAFGPSSLASLADVADEKKRGTTMGLYSVVITVGLTLGPISVGFLSDHVGPDSVIVFFVLVAVLMVVFVVLRFLDVRSITKHMREQGKMLTDGAEMMRDSGMRFFGRK